MIQSLVGLGRLCSVSAVLKSQRFLTNAPIEPDYLDRDGPGIPSYELINVQLKSYDFTVLESFSSYVHKTAQNMGITVEDCWATPCKKYEINTYKPASLLVENQYSLNMYERNIQVSELPTTKAPIFFQVLQTALPEGVNLNIKEHEYEDENVRYVPDLELKELKAQLDELGGPSTKKR
nr:EOG090X0MUO [Leptodora kindtii]